MIKSKYNTPEDKRIHENYSDQKNWLKWGPYLSERQWGTVREDYSAHGNVWEYFPHDHARSRAYRWGEDGLGGISDENQQLCFALSLWNGKDSILKERLFGLTGPEGNHAEDCKELYYYLDNTPMHTYMKYLYKYPHTKFPYDKLVKENKNRSRKEPEYELLDTGIFDDNKYFDVFVEYAKIDTDDILIKITAHNRSEEAAELTLLPTLWYRNEWSFDTKISKPGIELMEEKGMKYLRASHVSEGDYYLYFDKSSQVLFTENETNLERIFNTPNKQAFVKDAFHKAVTNNDYDFISSKTEGTKCSPVNQQRILGKSNVSIKLRLCKKQVEDKPFDNFEESFHLRIKEANQFYERTEPEVLPKDFAKVNRQAFAGLLWTKQFYYFDVEQWLEGDPEHPSPPESRKKGRNKDWPTLRNRDIISMPDKWEYPWYAVWDLAFHCIPLAVIDANFAKRQLLMFLGERYMKPSGQVPAYEWSFSDDNPPVHVWAVLRVYQLEKEIMGKGDIDFLKRAFHKLLINFTWWVNKKDENDNNIFEGGFLGLDNIAIFDRNTRLSAGWLLEQADSTSWMAMYSAKMMLIALEISMHDAAYENVASKFLEHYVYITESMNDISDKTKGLWDDEEGFYFDFLRNFDGRSFTLKVRSLVGLTPIFAHATIRKEHFDKLPNFKRRFERFRRRRENKSMYNVLKDYTEGENIMLSFVPKERMERIIVALLDENEFLALGGIRSLSKKHEEPYQITIGKDKLELKYEPGESTSDMFGGNSNWRGPIWMPMNYLILESLLRYYYFYKDDFKVEYPSFSGNYVNLKEVVFNLVLRIINMFAQDKNGVRPIHASHDIYRNNEHFSDLILFYEYFHGENSKGLGASHQTGWTGLVSDMIYWLYSELD